MIPNHLFLATCVFALVGGDVLSEEFSLPLGERQVVFRVTEGGVRKPGPVLISLHSNESTSTQVARALLPSHAGVLYEIQAGGSRRIPVYPNSNRVTIDPNRVFSRAGIVRDLNRFSIFNEADADRCVAFGEDIILAAGIRKGRT
ncbi:MAG: hypothetical protein AAF236_16130, partial [Verrucomicrobiota bacterium]